MCSASDKNKQKQAEELKQKQKRKYPTKDEDSSKTIAEGLTPFSYPCSSTSSSLF
jgi:hypothetical protein